MKAVRLLLLGFSLAATSAMAQLGMPGMGMPSLKYNPILLMDDNVQKDLALSPEVSSKVGAAVRDGLSKIAVVAMSTMSGQKKLSDSEKAKMGMDALGAYTSLENKVVAYLTPKQRARLHQISLQVTGPQALSDPSVATEIGLNAKQRALLAQKYAAVVLRDAPNLKSSLDTSKGVNMLTAVAGQQKKLRKGYLAAIDAVLTPAQKQNWARLQGKHCQLGFVGQMVSTGFGGG